LILSIFHYICQDRYSFSFIPVPMGTIRFRCREAIIIQVFVIITSGLAGQNRFGNNIPQYKAPDSKTIISEPSTNFRVSTLVAPLPNKPASANTVTVIPLGTSANGIGWGYAGGQRTHLWADDSLKTIALVHRMGPASSPPNISGYLAVDKAENMGQSPDDWVTNWQIYASNRYSGGSYQDEARFPQAGIVNFQANSNPNNSYITYFAPVLANSSSWGNYADGRVKWDNQSDSTKHITAFNPPPYHYTPEGFFISQDNKAFVVDLDYNSITGLYNNNLIVGVGTWNNTTHDFQYAYSALPLTTAPGTIPLHPRIAADPSGQKVWIACIGDNGGVMPVTDSSYYYPILFHSLDGGQTWSDPISIVLDGPFGISAVRNFVPQWLLDSLWNGDPPPRDQIAYSTAFDCDLVVDFRGAPHIGVGIHLAGNNAYSLIAIDSAFAIFHIYSNSYTNGQYWCGRGIGSPEHFRGYFPASQGITEDNRVNVSINKTGDHLFFTWLDSQSAGDTANDHPDVFARGYDLNKCFYTNSSGADAGTNITGSSSISRSAWFADAPYYVFSKPDKSYIIPVAAETISGGDIISNPVSFKYISDFSFYPDDFTILSINGYWGDFCYWNYCYEGINENSINNSVLTASVNPNPATESATLVMDIPETGLVVIDFYSVLGEHLFHKEFDFSLPGRHIATLDVSHFTPGIYFYAVSLKAQRTSGKLIVD
jgi:hypothetical protein